MKRNSLLVLTLIFLEWLDFSLYLYLAKSIFAHSFFPPSDYSLTLSFALFTLAYFARPLGGWLFGRQADLNGRCKPMIFSAALMGFATLGICFLPNYAVAGLWATWGLLVLRSAQSLALGGEMNTSAMFLIEHHAKNPLIAGSLVAISAALGMFLGGAIAALIQSTQFLWRIIFAAVGLISLWVCRLRKQLCESPEFQKNLVSSPDWLLHWRGLANIAAAGVFVSVTVYLCNVFWVTFAAEQLWSKTQCAWLGSFAQLASAVVALPIAYWFRPHQAPRLLQASMLLMSLTAPALFYFTAQHQAVFVLWSLFAYALANGLLCASLYYFLYLQLPAQYRCCGVSTVWGVAAGIGTMSLPLAEHAVTQGILWLPGLLVSTLALFSLILLTRFSLRDNYSLKSETAVLY